MDGTSNTAHDNALSMATLFKGRKVVVFGVPAPFTGTCTTEHVPGYVAAAGALKETGVDEIICYSVACPYAHYNWAESMGVDQSAITFLADTTAEFALEHSLSRDYSAVSLGLRSERFSMVVADGVVQSFQIVDSASEDAEVVLKQCWNMLFYT